MNLILLFGDDFLPGTHTVRLTDRRLQHILHVHRAGVGSELRVGLCGGLIGRGRITRCGGDAVEMDVELTDRPPEPVPVTLLLALPRPKILRRVLRTAAAMGVKRIVLLNTWRVEKSFWSSPALEPDALREQLILGLEQACDTVLPRIDCRKRFKPFVEDEVSSLAAGTLALVAHPGAAELCPRSVGSAVTLAIGPEGGFTSYEIALLGAHGFTAVSLGERRLAVESAVAALLARLF